MPELVRHWSDGFTYQILDGEFVEERRELSADREGYLYGTVGSDQPTEELSYEFSLAGIPVASTATTALLIPFDIEFSLGLDVVPASGPRTAEGYHTVLRICYDCDPEFGISTAVEDQQIWSTTEFVGSGSEIKEHTSEQLGKTYFPSFGISSFGGILSRSSAEFRHQRQNAVLQSYFRDLWFSDEGLPIAVSVRNELDSENPISYTLSFDPEGNPIPEDPGICSLETEIINTLLAGGHDASCPMN